MHENRAAMDVHVQLQLLSEQFHVLGRKEGNILFNDALNIFYLRLYGVGHMEPLR